MSDQGHDFDRHMAAVEAAVRRDFESRIPAATIEQMLADARARFDTARVTTFVPILIDRDVRQRLRRESTPSRAA
jgi:hypothetical protein